MRKFNVIAIVLAGMLLAGCGSNASSAAFVTNGSASRASASADYAVAEEAYAEDTTADYYDGGDLDAEYAIEDSAVSGGTGTTSSAGVSGSDIAEVDTSKKIVYRMSYSVETTDLDQLDAALQAKVNALGGYIEDASVDGNNYYDSSSSNTRRRYAYYTIRIPAEHLDEFAESVEEGSNVLSRTKSTEDITTSYIDADSRRKSLEEELEVLDNMADKAETIEDLIQIEAQRTEVRADLENIQSQLKAMKDRVQYSTINLDVTEVTVLTDTTPQDLSWQERIANGFTTSCENLLETTQEIAIWIASNIPMILFWVVIVVIALVLLRFVLWIAGGILGIRRKRKNKKDKRAIKDTRTVAEAPTAETPATKASDAEAQTPETDEKE